ncbi:hypothetical protein Micbo1qcDRAFT_160300 [Microdochium bolleyi]|uniref:Uncharacterized protein n=1 Tax=Microdochium bolleyi TaxID=196109 RepID=A0A136J6D1_9PEZI|nr:hypothetical protein Micbo1qcDRAFT_160300 [Microdochium bolleyi]
MTVSAAPDPTAETWNTFKEIIHQVLDRIGGVLDVLTPEARESGVLYDDMLGVTAHLALESRDLEVRKRAMARWARMISPRSSWENKSCFMAAVALMTVEEEGRVPLDSSSTTAVINERPMTAPSVEIKPESEGSATNPPKDHGADGRQREPGVIPIEAQYTWTGGTWDPDFRKYTVAMRPKLPLRGQEGNAADDEPERKVVLDLDDFHFGRSTSSSLEVVGRLRQYLGK